MPDEATPVSRHSPRPAERINNPAIFGVLGGIVFLLGMIFLGLIAVAQYSNYRAGLDAVLDGSQINHEQFFLLVGQFDSTFLKVALLLAGLVLCGGGCLCGALQNATFYRAQFKVEPGVAHFLPGLVLSFLGGVILIVLTVVVGFQSR